MVYDRFKICILTLAFLFNGFITSSLAFAQTEKTTTKTDRFERELRDLMSRLNIPGFAYAIVKDRRLISSEAFGQIQGSPEPFQLRTPLRIASVTKSFTAIIALQLVEEKRLKLSQSVKAILPDIDLNGDIKVIHLLNHTSEGEVGNDYLYSTNRYALLAKVVEKIEASSFESIVNRRIIKPAKMKSYDSPWLGAHAGLVSTVSDMSQYLIALQQGKLISEKSLKRLIDPSRETDGHILPISLGWFSQVIYGKRILWSFGQDDPDHSGALLIHIPDEKLSLFILANSNRISDPFRLLMGDIAKSPFALSFLRIWPEHEQSMELILKEFVQSQFESLSALSKEHFRHQLFSDALIDVFKGDLKKADIKILQYLNLFSNSINDDPVFLYLAVRVNGTEIKRKGTEVGKNLLKRFPNNRWILLFQGYLQVQLGENDRAVTTFETIISLPEQHPDFLRRLFVGWGHLEIARVLQLTNPAKAKKHLEQIVALKVGGETQANALQLLENINAIEKH